MWQRRAKISNIYFDWPASASRFIRFDTVRAADLNDALDAVSAGFDDVQTDLLTAAAASLAGTSTTSVSIGTGSKSFTASTSKGWSVGQLLVAASAGTPTAYMVGQVTAYNSSTGALTINVAAATDTAGAGSYTDWNINVSGKTGPTATLGGSASSGINELGGGTIASAATTMDIWAAAKGNLMTVTGTTTTTGLPAAPQAGAERWLVAADAWPLTAGANLLIAGVASGQTVTLAAGDMVLVRAITTTQFRCVVFRASGAPTVAGLLHVRDEKTAGTGAGSLTANAWNVRTLNTVVANTIAGASLGSNQVTLPAGTYDIEASAPQYSGSNTFHSRLKITNVTDGAALVYGQNVHHSLGGTAQLRARVTLAAQKVLQVEHWISVGVTVTGGEPQSAGTAEYYTELFIERVGA